VVDIVVPVATAEEARQRRLAQPRASLDSLMAGDNVVMGKDPASSQAAADEPPPVLTELVRPTAGQVIPLTSKESISSVFKATLEDFRASYVLRYVAQGVKDEGWHEIEVSLKKRGRFDIRARRGYMGRGRIGTSEAPGDTHSRARVEWPRSVVPAVRY
jgi:hypothetical protein